ncbi:N-acetylmuramoyl-L-alanine amidase, partial [Parolsenella sp. LCP21S3_E11]|uniref:N-acetylmuramoyl-L-alanine amidase family protein n=1 Tax=Parolsenella sp. LCP21S3_E11 TaxID=3438797 RepID=UPI003F9C1DCF
MRKVAWSIIGTLFCLGVMAALSPRSAQAEGTNASPSIDYVYIDSSNLSLGEEQKVAIGFSSVPESSPRSLVLTGGDGSNYEMSLTSNVGFDYLFSSDSLPAQQYAIAGVLCESGETLPLGEEVDAVFSVGAHDDSSVTAFDIDDGDGFETAFVGDDQTTASLVDLSGLEDAAGAGTPRFTIALDAGHGGWDSGAIGNGLQEKTLTLKIAQYCREELEQYEGVKVVMLRDSDASLTSNNSTREELQRRCDVAHENHANFYMSFHINSGGGAGAEVWIPTESTWYQTFHEEGASVGNKVLDRITALGLSNRGLKEGHYEVNGNKLYYPDGSEADSLAVIRYCREYGIPAVLVEHGFIDNPADAAKLSDGAFLRQLGVADAQAIADRFGLSKVKKPAPVIADTDNGSVTLQWEETPGAAQYAVAVRNEDGSFKTYTYDCADTSYTVTGLTNGKTYQFLVQAKVDGKWTPYSELDLVECELVPQPRFTAEPAGDGEVQLNWGAIDGADAYAVAERLADGSY